MPVVPEDMELRVSRRARRLRIDVTAHRGVVVVVPQGTPADVVERFVAAKGSWIEQARARVMRDAAAMPRPQGPPLPATLELRALAEAYAVAIFAAGRRCVTAIGERVVVEGAPAPADARAALAGWLKRRARVTLEPRLAEHAQAHGLAYGRVAVRGQRTRWASCSGRGTISLNFKLLFLPPELVDHVLLHELAHTRHLNHSPRFWRLLAELDPQWRDHHEALARAGQWLPAWVEIKD